MYTLEKRALMGDREAQLECTEKGIVLSCPCCGKTVNWDFDSEMVYHNYGDCILSGKFIPLNQWNSRPAPPFPRCDECNSWCGTPGDDFIAACCLNECFMENNNYCIYFNPKEE